MWKSILFQQSGDSIIELDQTTASNDILGTLSYLCLDNPVTLMSSTLF